MGVLAFGGSYIQNRNVSNFATSYQLVLNGAGGGVSIGGYNSAFAQAPFTCTIYGTAYSTSGTWSGSDVRYKKNIQPIGDALNRVMKLRGVSYDFKTEEFADLHFDKDKQLGVIAQEVEEVFPELVKTDKEGFKAVSYEKLAPILIEAIKEQQAQIASLHAKVENVVGYNNDSLEVVVAAQHAQIEALTTQNTLVERQLAEILSRLNAFDTDLQQCCFEHSNAKGAAGLDQQSALDSPQLEQNQPNPFHENTTIRYYLPNGTRTACIAISDLNGVQLKTFDLSGGRGVGQVLIGGGAFAAGTYVYTLTVDGKQVDSKRMVLM
jgi:hypothetical protein